MMSVRVNLLSTRASIRLFMLSTQFAFLRTHFLVRALGHSLSKGHRQRKKKTPFAPLFGGQYTRLVSGAYVCI